MWLNKFKKRNAILICYTLFIFPTLLCNAHPNGAPSSDDICTSMRPFHGELSMNSDLPFKISLDRVFVRGAGKIRVKVESIDPSKYTLAGFMFMVKKPNEMGKAFGIFDPSLMKEDLKTISCFSKLGSALTHSHNRPKTAVSFEWIAPNITSGMYEFHATLVRDFNSFWADYIYPRRIEVSVNAPANSGIISCLKKNYLLLAASMFLLFIKDS